MLVTCQKWLSDIFLKWILKFFGFSKFKRHNMWPDWLQRWEENGVSSGVGFDVSGVRTFEGAKLFGLWNSWRFTGRDGGPDWLQRWEGGRKMEWQFIFTFLVGLRPHWMTKVTKIELRKTGWAVQAHRQNCSKIGWGNLFGPPFDRPPQIFGKKVNWHGKGH